MHLYVLFRCQGFQLSVANRFNISDARTLANIQRATAYRVAEGEWPALEPIEKYLELVDACGPSFLSREGLALKHLSTYVGVGVACDC